MSCWTLGNPYIHIHDKPGSPLGNRPYPPGLIAPLPCEVPSWVAVMFGQDIMPDGYDPVVDARDEERVIGAIQQMRGAVAATANGMPPHEAAFG